MTKGLDREVIAEAMREAGRKAVHGTREEQAGKFKPPRTSAELDEAAPSPRGKARA